MRLILAVLSFIFTGIIAYGSIVQFMGGSIGWGVTLTVWGIYCLTIGVANLFAIYFKD